MIAGPIMDKMGNPLARGYSYCATMSRAGTSTSDMAFEAMMKPGYGAGRSTLVPVAGQRVRGVDQQNLRRSDDLRRRQGNAGQAGHQALDRQLAVGGQHRHRSGNSGHRDHRASGINPAESVGRSRLLYTMPQLAAILDKAAADVGRWPSTPTATSRSIGR